MRNLFQKIQTNDNASLGLMVNDLGHVVVVARHPVSEGLGGKAYGDRASLQNVRSTPSTFAAASLDLSSSEKA